MAVADEDIRDIDYILGAGGVGALPAGAAPQLSAAVLADIGRGNVPSMPLGAPEVVPSGVQVRALWPTAT